MMQTETSVQLGASLTLETAESAATLHQKQLFEKFWKGTFKAVAMPRPESVIVASIIACTRLTRLQAPPPPADANTRKEVTSGSGVPPAGRDSCIARKRRHHRHRRARSASFDDELSLRPKAKKKKRKSDKSRRRRRRSPSCSLSPLRKKKKKKKNAKKSKRHRYSSKKSKHSSSSLKQKRKEERRHKKSSRTRSRRKRRRQRSASESSCCQSSAEDRHFVEKSESRQTPGRMALAHDGTNGVLVHKSVKTAAKYPSVLSTGGSLSSKLLEGTTSRHGGGAHDYDSGNDTSSPPSCKTAADGKSAERRRAASPGKMQFADKDDVSDSGNSVTSYASLCKTCRDDSLREHVMLGCRVDVMRSSETSGCSHEASESSGRSRSRGRKKKKKKRSRRKRCRSSGSSRYSGRHSRSLSSVRSYSRLPSYSPARRRRGSVSSSSSRGSYSRYSHDRSRSRRRTSSSRETDVTHKSSRKRRRREFYSPMRKRRKDSPSHLEARRITSARKRPVPYFRRSPSTCSSTTSWSSLFSRGRRFVRSLERSRSRGRSSSTSCCSYRSFSRSSSWNSVFGTQRRGIRRSRH
ncbi:serine/arginine repetitive matrix protein 4-like [Entelurus aequoreus]|uniref:serine/arginine repetitive matrix protein 4-like n=1 Tax=Entelurus aequoreus TaxID=161455 RepID=UPI002B1E1E33|nr:serine/arginine repetitive matrix protein 4-like [Entelurus aequoreus]